MLKLQGRSCEATVTPPPVRQRSTYFGGLNNSPLPSA